MTNHLLTTAARLSDRDLLTRLPELAGRERAALVELLAYLAVLDTRPSVYLAAGYGTLMSYCTGALRLSEDAAYNRVEAARACRRFPVILGMLAEGAVTLTAVRLLGRHLTPENHAEVLAAARGRTRPEIEALVARLAPRPDLQPMIRRVPDPQPAALFAPSTPEPAASAPSAPIQAPSVPPQSSMPVPPPRRVIRASAPGRYHVQLTIGQETHDRFRRLQSLLARECRGGDPVAVFDLACRVLEEKVLREKRAATSMPRKRSRSGTAGPRREPTRDVPAEVSRVVWARDGERCAFVGPGGVRCTETKYLELHHVVPWANRPAVHGGRAGRALSGPQPTRGGDRLRAGRGRQASAGCPPIARRESLIPKASTSCPFMPCSPRSPSASRLCRPRSARTSAVSLTDDIHRASTRAELIRTRFAGFQGRGSSQPPVPPPP